LTFISITFFLLLQ